MPNPKILFVISVTLLGGFGCKDPAPPAPDEAVKASQLPEIRVKPGAKQLFTYYAPADGRFTTVDTIDAVPAPHRGWVRVVDLGMRPTQRRDHELVYVADLRDKGKDGTYPYVVMSRAGFETAAQGRPKRGATAPSPAKQGSGEPTSEKEASPGRGADKQVIVYSTSWCGACRAARSWLNSHGVPFVDKDIEKDARAAAELMQKAKQAGISASGVPVIDVRGTLIQGFDPDRLTALLGDKR